MAKYFLFYFIVLMWTNLPVIYMHRELAHRQIKFILPMVYLIKLIEWSKYSRYRSINERAMVASHIRHHKFSDSDKDPHLPWLTMTPMTRKEIFDSTKNYNFVYSKFDMFLEKFRYGNLVLLAAFYMLWAWEGCVLWAIMSIVCPWYYRMFNMLTHTVPGYTIGKMMPGCKARNLITPFALLFMGDRLHGNHHIWPARANLAIKWWEIDQSFVLIKVLSWFKLVKVTESGKSKEITDSTEFNWIK